MTLIIGIKCKDGLIIAADSMTTEAAPQGGPLISKHVADKIVIQRDLVWGASGSAGVKQVVQEAIESNYGKIYNRNKSAVFLRQQLVDVIQPVTARQYNLVAKTHEACGRRGELPHTNLIFGAYVSGEFHLINIEWDMGGEVVVAKHCSVGSGMKTGQALLCRLRNQDWDLQSGAVIAYRTMNDAIHVEPMGIGPPIRIARFCTKDGKPCSEMVADGEMERLKSAAEAWTGVEQDVLTNLLNPQPSKTLPEPIPSPPSAVSVSAGALGSAAAPVATSAPAANN